jgi:sarcosine oxidase subunit gamma
MLRQAALMLTPTAPLEQLADVPHAGGVATAALALSPVCDRAWLLLQGDAADEQHLRTTLLRRTGLLLPQPGRTLTSGARSILWLGPREWLLEIPGREQAAVDCAFAADLAQTCNVLTAVSDALAGFDINGMHAPELFAGGCSVDLSPNAFDTGSVCRTVLADAPVIVWRRSAHQGYRCLADRSLSHHLWSWFVEWGGRNHVT